MMEKRGVVGGEETPEPAEKTGGDGSCRKCPKEGRCGGEGRPKESCGDDQASKMADACRK